MVVSKESEDKVAYHKPTEQQASKRAIESENEAKVVFHEMNQVRALRGKLIDEDEKFVTLVRSDGTYRISKNNVIKIQQKGTSTGDAD